MSAPSEIAPLRIEIPEALDFLLEPHRYKVAYGGRGSAKSWSAARVLIGMARSEKKRLLCAREVQKSIKDSVYKLLADQIELMGQSPAFEVLKTEIRCVNGSEFVFSGLANVTAESIKSFEGVDIVWVEEAQTVSARSWELLIPTIRKAGSEIWITMNPDQEEDAAYQRFIKTCPPGAIVRKINWEENPWFPDELRTEMEYLYRVDPEAAAHVWGGQCRRVTDAQVLRGRFRVESFEPERGWDGPYYGADWGFSVDPTALIRMWVNGRTLYLEHEAYGVGIELDNTPELFDTVPEARKHVIRADNARPETIAFMKRHGYPLITAAAKGPGSVEDGVEFLRSFEMIVIHSRCKHAAEEARLWSYKTDAGGNVLPILLDRNNHIWDGVRYGLEPISRGRGRMQFSPKALAQLGITPQSLGGIR